MQFYGLYADFETFNATQEYSDMAIERAIAMHEGDSIPGFPSVDVLQYLIAPQLDKLRDPALELIQDCYAQLEALASSIVERIFMRVPALRPEIMDIICQVLQRERDHTRELVEAVIDSEQNYMFVNDADYKENRTSIVPQEEQMPPQYDANGQPIPQQPQQQPVRARGTNIFVKEIRARIDSVFKITIRTVRETIPKLIGYFLVRMSQEKLQAELYQKINENESILESLGEPKHITERRRTLTEIIKTLRESLKVLQRDPE